MLIQCNNKKCYAKDHFKLNTTDNEVYCSECGNAISDITEFTKKSLKSIGQHHKGTSDKKSYQYECEHCGVKVRPEIKTKELHCPLCNGKFEKIHFIVKNMLLENLPKYKEEI